MIRATSYSRLVALIYSKASNIDEGYSEVYHVWDQGSIVVDFTFGAGPYTTTLYQRGTGLLAREVSGVRQYYLHNGHGDVVQMVDGAGNAAVRYDYDAFGNLAAPVAGDLNPFRYCGEYFDKGSETYYLRARYYNPRIGRFTSEDVAKDGMNWYTYCGGNPVMFVDSSGKSMGYSMGYSLGYSGGSATPKAQSRGKGKELTNYLHNSGLNFFGYIADQHSGNAASTKVGSASGADVGCGWVASYNALLTMGDWEHPADIIKYYEDNNGLMFDGAWGTKARKIVNYFDDKGYDASFYQGSWDDAAQSHDAIIIEYAWANLDTPKVGAHYIMATYDSKAENYTLYNETKKIDTFDSINAYMREEGYVGMATIGINKK